VRHHDGRAHRAPRACRIDAFPDTTPVQVQINTVAPALSPLEIERQITAPIEQVDLGPAASARGAVDLALRSLAGHACSSQTEPTSTCARQVAMERPATVELAPGITPPSSAPWPPDSARSSTTLVTGKDKSLAELRTIQDWIIKPQLRSVPGVAEVNAWGGDERQVQVLVDPVALQKHDLTLRRSLAGSRENNTNVGGGTVDQPANRASSRASASCTRPKTRPDRRRSARRACRSTSTTSARVVEGREIRRGAVTADGKGEVVLGSGSCSWARTAMRSQPLRLRLEEFSKSLPQGVEVTPSTIARRSSTTCCARSEEPVRGRAAGRRGAVRFLGSLRSRA
jgi:cobalt-zinc-cadmium resistance protein CzcA